MSRIEPKDIVCLRGVSYRYPAGKMVPDDLSLTVSKGDIFGFLGPNGSGKSTTIKLMLGLLRAYSGTIERFGEPGTGYMYKATGAMVEEPSLYGHLSARKNLLLTANVRGIASKRVDEVLELTGMLHHADQKTAGFSTGMKQRTALALALLDNPELLILDEPGNGLDPPGIIELRNLLMHLNNEYGTTILFSSHQLAEVQKLCTKIGLIKKGKVLFEGSLGDLQHMQRDIRQLFLVVEEVSDAAEILVTSQYQFTIEDNTIIVNITNETEVPIIVKELVERGVKIYQVSSPAADLEDIFIRLTDSSK